MARKCPQACGVVLALGSVAGMYRNSKRQEEINGILIVSATRYMLTFLVSSFSSPRSYFHFSSSQCFIY